MNRPNRDPSTRVRRGRLLRLLAEAACAAVLSLAATTEATAGGITGLGASPADVEKALDTHTLRTLDGRTLRLGELRGSVVVVNFWASWCPPCRRELPRLGRLRSELAGPELQVIAVSIDEDVENARRFCRARGVTLPVAHDGPNGLARALDLQSVPFTLVLDPAGHVAYTTARSDERAMSELAATTRRLVASSAPAVETVAEGAR